MFRARLSKCKMQGLRIAGSACVVLLSSLSTFSQTVLPPSVRCDAPATISQGASATVKIIASSPNGSKLSTFFLASAGTLTTSAGVVTAGRFTGNASTATFSTAGVQPGPAYLFCHATDVNGRTVSSTSTVMVVQSTPAPTVACTAPASVSAGSPINVVAAATSNSALTYSFSTTAGALSTNGNTATVDTSGLTGTQVAVTCNVKDSIGQTASAKATTFVNGGTGEQAQTASTFTDSVGINVHLHYSGTPYVDSFPAFLNAMQDLGIKHYRNGIDPYPYDFEFSNAEALAKAGIKGAWIIDEKDGAGDITKLFARAPNSIEAIEGPNETFGKAGPWLTNFMQMLSSTVRSNAASANTTIYAPTVTTLDAVGLMGNLSAYADLGNMHDYYSPRYPETPAYGDTFFGCGYYGTFSFNLCVAKVTVPNKPVVSTETGYKSDAVSDAAIGRYLPRILMMHLQGGVTRTYLYELYDEAFSPNFGLIRSDLTPKPAYYAIKNLMGIFRDEAGFTTPGKLDYQLSGQTGNLQHVLFQKKDGTFLLALWVGVPSADGLQTLYPSAQNITLKVNTPTGTPQVYSLDDAGSLSTTAAATSNSGLMLSITDKVTVLALPAR